MRTVGGALLKKMGPRSVTAKGRRVNAALIRTCEVVRNLRRRTNYEWVGAWDPRDPHATQPLALRRLASGGKGG